MDGNASLRDNDFMSRKVSARHPHSFASSTVSLDNTMDSDNLKHFEDINLSPDMGQSNLRPKSARSSKGFRKETSPSSISPRSRYPPARTSNASSDLALKTEKRSAKFDSLYPGLQVTTDRPIHPRSLSAMIPTQRAQTFNDGFCVNVKPRPSSAVYSPRRISWAGHRRNSSAAEREFDNDLGNDLSDDMILMNVPLTPSNDSKARAYFPKQPDAQFEDTIKVQPRSKSWGLAMNGLVPDARDLTMKYDEMITVNQSFLGNSSIHGTSYNGHKSRHVSDSPVELPPKQIWDFSDPVPISKQKEAALGRTRPGWLPPKPKKEEKKHLKEYKQMMAMSKEADHRRSLKDIERRQSKEVSESEHWKLWEDYVFSKPNSQISSTEMRSQVWQGVPPRFRSAIWRKCFGNSLSISKETFGRAIERSNIAKLRLAQIPKTDWKDSDRRWATIIKLIDEDVSSTFADLRLFRHESPLHEDLITVLQAYANYRNDLPYVRGINYIAAMLLLNMNSTHAFTALVNLLNRPLLMALYNDDDNECVRFHSLFLDLLRTEIPSLYRHFHTNLALPPDLYLDIMLKTVFAKILPLDLTNRIWDIYAFEGDPFLLQTALGLLKILEPRLYCDQEEIIMILTQESHDRVLQQDEETLIDHIRSVRR